MNSFSFLSLCLILCVWNVRSLQCHSISREQPTRLGLGNQQHCQMQSFHRNRNFQASWERHPFAMHLSKYAQQHVLLLQATSSPLSSGSTSINQEDTNKSPSNKFLKLSMHLLSVFLVVSYLQPLQFSENLAFLHVVLDPLSCALRKFVAFLPPQVWSLIHAVSGMIFGGSILCTAMVEWMWPDELQQMLNDRSNQEVTSDTATNIDDLSLQLLLNKMATKTLFPMEGKLVLPAVTGSMISGIAQSFCNYGSLRFAPLHVKSSLHLMFLFGLWWALTDRKSQDDIIRLSSMHVDSSSTKVTQEVSNIWKRRRFFNFISCLFVLALYGIMVLKPGFVG
jgi:hypothetical protein